MSAPSLSELLADLLALHASERELMQASRHEEHMDCVRRKLDMAREVESRLAAGAALSAADRATARAIHEAATANAAIAAKLLSMAKSKMSLIQSQGAPSYGSDGRMLPPSAAGGLLDIKT